MRYPIFIVLAFCLFLQNAFAVNANDELLPPDQAFRLSTQVLDSQTLEASWEIADGYYLYRDKFKFESLEKTTTLKPPMMPAGKKKSDPLFGIVETFTKSVAIRLPLDRTNSNPHTMRLRIHAQGCNEPVGVCYPPIIKEMSFQLAQASPPSGQGYASLNELTRLVDSGSQQEFLKPDEAFVLTLYSKDGASLTANIVIAEGYYLYRDKTKFELIDTGGDVKLGDYKLPQGKVKIDEFVGRTKVFYHNLDVTLPFTGSAPGPENLVLRASYQGCAEKGICYPPANKIYHLTWAQAAVMNIIPADTASLTLTLLSEDQTAEQTPSNIKAVLTAMIAAFGAGLLLTFTPCVLPMIPILSSIIVGQGDKQITKLKGGILALSYVLGTSVTYTAAGVLAGASGEQLQAYFQNVWAIGTAGVIFTLLALSMFGFYEIQVPSFIQSRLQQRTQHIKDGSLVGVFFLGLVFALIVGACVSPILITALSGAILSRDPVLGGAIMFAMSLGMGVILIAVGVGAGYMLPKAGAWMDRVKQVFGVLLLAVAIYLLGLLPQVPVLFLWAALLIVTAVYLGATQTLPEGVGGWRYLWKGLGTVLLIWGFLALLGGLAGNRDILRPLNLADIPIISPEYTSSENKIEFETITSLADLEQRLANARATGKPVIVDYFASWCTDCIRMEKITFGDPAVRLALQDFVLLKPDVTDAYAPESKAMKQRFGILGPPATLFFSANGEERKDLHFYGFMPANEFLQKLEQT